MAEITNRDKTEAKIARELARLGAQQRKELEAMLGNPPDIKRVPDGWWKDKERELEAAALLLLFIPFEQSAKQHGLEAAAAAEAAAKFAKSRAAELAKGFRQHSRDMLRTASRSWTPNESITKAQMRETTLRLFGPQRMANVAVTETTVAQHQGSEHAIRKLYGLSEDDTWYTELDGMVCPICRPLHAEKRSKWSQEAPDGPPAHVNCRCWISYAPQPEPAN